MSLRVGDKIFALFVKIFCSRSCSSALCQAPRRRRRNLPGFLTLTCCKYFNLFSLLSSYLLCKFTSAFPLYGLFGIFRLVSGFLNTKYFSNIFKYFSNIIIYFSNIIKYFSNINKYFFSNINKYFSNNFKYFSAVWWCF